MVVSLEAEECQRKGVFGKIRSLFHPYEISAKIRKQNKISVLQLKYISYRGGIRLSKLYPFMTGCNKTILCSKEVDLKDSPFERFENSDLSVKLMINYICNLLDKSDLSPNELKIGLFDPMAAYPELTDKLLHYTSQLTVVSDLPRYYEIKSDQLMDEYGIPLIVSNSTDALFECDIIISPQTINQRLPVSSQSLVFSVDIPAVSLNYNVFYDYITDVPYKYQRIKPNSTGNVYFLSALYSLCGVKELERIIPEKCSDGEGLYTTERLLQRLQNFRKSA